MRIFCLSLGGLLFVYTAIAVYTLLMRSDAGGAELAAGVLRIAFGLALALLFCWGWLAEPLERQVGLMGALSKPTTPALSTGPRSGRSSW